MQRTFEPPPQSAAWRGLWALACVTCAVTTGCGRPSAPPNDATRPDEEPNQQPSSSLFERVHDSVETDAHGGGPLGIDFRHNGGDLAAYAMPNIMAGGGAVFDYDNDGDLDIYLTQTLETSQAGAALLSHSANQLYKQEANGSFTNATEASNSGHAGHGMGTAVGDIDNDGDMDLFVTNLGPDALLLNHGDGTFSDISVRAGVANDGWSMSATFFDYNRDGLLDLYVTRYIRFDPSLECTQENGERDYCGPTAFAGEHDLLYRNQGDGTFVDVSEDAGLLSVRDAGLGLVAADLNNDGWIDVYVANDADPNNLWINQGDGTFEDHAMILGVAVNQQGAAEAGMGVALGDVDGDSHLDLLVSHLIGESNTLYRSLDSMSYLDTSARAGLVATSFDYTGFGTALLDLNNDGALDAAVVNGAVKRRPQPLTRDEALSEHNIWGDYAEPNLLFLGRGTGEFVLANDCGAFCASPSVSRSLFPADLNHDGGLDLLVTSIVGPMQLFRNRAERGNWVELRLLRPDLNREAHGATVASWTNLGCSVHAAIPLGGYLAGGHPRVHVGLGDSAGVDRFEVLWPSGVRETFPGTPANRVVELREGYGQPDRNVRDRDDPSDTWSRPCR